MKTYSIRGSEGSKMVVKPRLPRRLEFPLSTSVERADRTRRKNLAPGFRLKERLGSLTGTVESEGEMESFNVSASI